MTSKNNIVYESSSLVENKNFKVNETYKRNSHFFKNSMFKGNIQNIQNNITPSERNSNLFGNNLGKGNIQNNVTPSGSSNFFENNLGKIYNKPINLVNNLVQKSKKKYFWENVNEPSIWVSLLIPSYNTPKEFLISCINSIKEQFGTFGLEIVWINDSSNDVATNILVNLLETIIRPLKNCKLIYERLEENSGISNCLNYGVNLCSNEIIFRMDSDDIMKNHRIVKQLNFILSNPQCVMCGTNITAF